MNGVVVSIETVRVRANGIDFHCLPAGPCDAPLVILLHGFPEFSFAWREQILPLADAGFRVIAPDQRGYGQSSKPKQVSAYGLEALAQDVVGLADALDRRQFSIVGHDWGGIVAWRIASDLQERLNRLAIINAPNLDVAFGHMLRSPLQLLRSSYVASFQLPFMPEWVLSASNFSLLSAALRSTSNVGTFPDAAMKLYKDAWSQPAALTSMLNWYRALPALPARRPVRISTPSLVIWGDRDTALDASLAEDSAALCDDVEIHHRMDATHWVHHEHPRAVNRHLLEFLQRSAK